MSLIHRYHDELSRLQESLKSVESLESSALSVQNLREELPSLIKEAFRLNILNEQLVSNIQKCNNHLYQLETETKILGIMLERAHAKIASASKQAFSEESEEVPVGPEDFGNPPATSDGGVIWARPQELIIKVTNSVEDELYKHGLSLKSDYIPLDVLKALDEIVLKDCSVY